MAERHVHMRVHLALIFIQITFGGFHVYGKYLLDHLHPLALAGARVIMATPLLFLLAWRVDPRIPAARDLIRLAVLGLFGVFCNQLLFITGLRYTTASSAGILMPSIPVFVVALAAVLHIERLSAARAAGVGLAVAGALVVLNPAALSLEGGASFGNLLIVLNCLSYGLFLVLQRPILRRLHPLTVVAWAFLFGGTGVVAVSAPTILETPWRSVPPPAWLGLLYVVLVATCANYALNTWAVGRSSSGLVATYITLQPLSSMILAFLFLGERLGWREGVSFVLIVAGLTLVSRTAGGGRAPSRQEAGPSGGEPGSPPSAG